MHRCLDGEASPCVTSLGLNPTSGQKKHRNMMKDGKLHVDLWIHVQVANLGAWSARNLNFFFQAGCTAAHERSMFQALRLWWKGFVQWVPVKAKIQCLVKPIGQCRGYKGWQNHCEVAKAWIYVVLLVQINELELSQRSIWHPSIWGLETRWTFGGWSWTGVAWPSNCVTCFDIFSNFLGICCRNRKKMLQVDDLLYVFFFADSGCITNMSWSVVRRRISWNGKLMV